MFGPSANPAYGNPAPRTEGKSLRKRRWLRIGAPFLAGLVVGALAWPLGRLLYVAAFRAHSAAERVAFWHRRYSASEGPENRGSSFFNLCLALNDWSMSGEPLNREQVREYLGAPDNIDEYGDEALFGYRYDKDSRGREVIYVVFEGDHVKHVAFGEADPPYFASWKTRSNNMAD